jgi:3-methyl-2-oxobutanoate hydroxymethyltransferase
MNKLKIEDILKKKKKEKITMLTCYDYSFAEILDEVGLDIILVGDSLANVILGMNQTRKVGVREMLAHTKAVAKAVKHSLVVADMPYMSYQKNPKKCVYYAEKFIEAGADAVKIEWFKDCPYVVRRIVKNKIPVMGHIGLTPQTVHLLGGYKVQGKDRKSALNLITQAKILERLGVFSIVLECIPYQVSQVITNQLKIPTIGIGAGKYCDGQVLVLYDLLNLYKKIKPKFVRIYADLHKEIKVAIAKFIIEVKNEKFPTLKESFSIKKEELRDFIKSNE